MRIQLMIPCLVRNPPSASCPLAFKAGDAANARALALRAFDLFAGTEPVVCPSGSCAKMLRRHADASDMFPDGQLPSCLNLVTGPSSTADIELVLVRGVHGPGALDVLGLDWA